MVLNCEMCGSSLDVNKAINDVVTCEYCDSATNIHGFIVLNMSSDERAAALMKRGFVLIEFKVWDKAEVVLRKAAEYDPENAKAYLGLLMVDTKVSKEGQLASHRGVLSDYVSYQKALEFADVELKSRLEAYNDETVERKRERERIQQEREAREQQKIEEEKEEARRFRKKLMKVAIVSLLVITVLTAFIIRSRNLALDNLRTFTELSSVVEFISLDSKEQEMNTRGLTSREDEESAYWVNSSLRRAAGFGGLTLHSWGIELNDATRFAGIELASVRQISEEFQEKYGFEIEVVEHEGRNVSPGSVEWMLSILDPTVTDIRFMKDDVTVIIRRTSEPTGFAPLQHTPGRGLQGGMQHDVSWSVRIGR